MTNKAEVLTKEQAIVLERYLRVQAMERNTSITQVKADLIVGFSRINWVGEYEALGELSIEQLANALLVGYVVRFPDRREEIQRSFEELYKKTQQDDTFENFEDMKGFVVEAHRVIDVCIDQLTYLANGEDDEHDES